MSSVSLCFYLLFSKKVRPHVPLPAMLTVGQRDARARTCGCRTVFGFVSTPLPGLTQAFYKPCCGLAIMSVTHCRVLIGLSPLKLAPF